MTAMDLEPTGARFVGGVELPLDQARRFVDADGVGRAHLHLEVQRTGTGESLVRDLVCNPSAHLSLRAFMRHVRRHARGTHPADMVELLEARYAAPVEPPDEDPADAAIAVPAREVRRRDAVARERLLNDPDVRRRDAGRGGEAYRPDPDEET